MTHYLGIDASTQSLTGMIIDVDTNTTIAETTINFDEHFSKAYGVTHGVVEYGDGVVHSFPLMWVEALELLFAALHRHGHDLSRIRAISGSGQQHGTVYLNAQTQASLGGLTATTSLRAQLSGIFSRPTAPIWMDSSTGAQCAEIERNVGGNSTLVALTGNRTFERFSGPQIRRFYQEDPEAYEQTTHISLVSSFMASVLAGEVVPVDAGDGSGTNLMDIHSRQWSTKALDATAPDLGEKLLSVARSDDMVGILDGYFVERYGFASDCKVFPFSGDNPCSLIGLGLVEAGSAALSLGTSDTLFACTTDAANAAPEETCLFASPDDEHYMALICFMNGSLAREAVRDAHRLDWSGFTEALATSSPGNAGALMLPYFDDEIVPHARAGVIRADLDDNDPTRNVRAVVEAQALSSRLHTQWLDAAGPLHVTGGGSANPEILKIFANVHNRPVHCRDTTNAAALGAALKACHGDHPDTPWSDLVAPFTSARLVIDPDPGTRGVYDDLLDRYQKLESRFSLGSE
jgi:xylulokinase